MKREQREAEALGEGEQQEQHGEKAVQIAAGWNHSLALTGEEMTATTITLGFGSFPKLSAQGSVLCWGSSRFNQIGSLAGTAEPSPKESAPPAFVQLLPVPMAGIESHVKITAISAGLHHSALLTSEGRLLTLGHGKFGELGHGDLATRTLPTVVDQLRDHFVTQVVCGQKHTACLTEQGHVFAWGDNTHGQLGIHHARKPLAQVDPPPIQPPASVSPKNPKIRIVRGTKQGREASRCPSPAHVDIPAKVTQLACGWAFTLAITLDAIYGFGRNNYGQLGLDDTANRSTPNLIPSAAWHGAAIKKVVCGSEHTLLLAEGQVYSWGWNEHGNLGLGDEHDRHSPHLIKAFAPGSVVDICTGGCHSFALVRWASTDGKCQASV